MRGFKPCKVGLGPACCKLSLRLFWGGSTCPYHQLKKQLLSLEKPQEAPRLLILTRSFSFEVSTRRSPNDGDTDMWQRHW